MGRLINSDEVVERAKNEAIGMVEPFKSQFDLLVEWIVDKTTTAYDVNLVRQGLIQDIHNGVIKLECGNEQLFKRVDEGGVT